MSLGLSIPIFPSSPIGRSRLTLLWLMAVVPFLLITRPIAAQNASDHVVTTVSGRVLNARTGAPLARVLVQANGRAVFTSAEGRFLFNDPAGIKSLQLTKPGFSLSPEQGDPENLFVGAATNEATVEAEMWPEAVLTGSVTSLEGDPLSRIGVNAKRTLLQNGVRQTLAAGSTLTDAHGGFRLPVPSGDYVLETRYAAPDLDRSLAVLPVQLPAHTAEDITGTIHISSGQELYFDLHPRLAPTFQITLPIDPIEGTTAQRSPFITVTNSSGIAYQSFRRVTPDGIALDLPSGTYLVSARLPASDGDHVGHLLLTVPDKNSTGPALHLELTPSVPVVVAADPAAPAPASSGDSPAPDASGLNLQLEPSGSSLDAMGGPPIRITGRGSGSYFRVPPGVYHLAGGEGSGWAIQSATYGGVDLLRQPLMVGPNAGAEPIRIVVERANGTITGVTRRAGVPASCWLVFVSDGGTLPRFFIRRSGTSGDFNFSGLPFRRFHLLALPLLSSADFGDSAILDQFHTYVQTIAVTASSLPALTLEAVPAHELYP